jgi:hypothetical protein
MAMLMEMDEHVTLARQMEEEDISGQIILFRLDYRTILTALD